MGMYTYHPMHAKQIQGSLRVRTNLDQWHKKVEHLREIRNHHWNSKPYIILAKKSNTNTDTYTNAYTHANTDTNTIAHTNTDTSGTPVSFRFYSRAMDFMPTYRPSSSPLPSGWSVNLCMHLLIFFVVKSYCAFEMYY